jgi:hypothetical protein
MEDRMSYDTRNGRIIIDLSFMAWSALVGIVFALMIVSIRLSEIRDMLALATCAP